MTDVPELRWLARSPHASPALLTALVDLAAAADPKAWATRNLRCTLAGNPAVDPKDVTVLATGGRPGARALGAGIQRSALYAAAFTRPGLDVDDVLQMLAGDRAASSWELAVNHVYDPTGRLATTAANTPVRSTSTALPHTLLRHPHTPRDVRDEVAHRLAETHTLSLAHKKSLLRYCLRERASAHPRERADVRAHLLTLAHLARLNELPQVDLLALDPVLEVGGDDWLRSARTPVRAIVAYANQNGTHGWRRALRLHLDVTGDLGRAAVDAGAHTDPVIASRLLSCASSGPDVLAAALPHDLGRAARRQPLLTRTLRTAPVPAAIAYATRPRVPTQALHVILRSDLQPDDIRTLCDAMPTLSGSGQEWWQVPVVTHPACPPDVRADILASIDHAKLNEARRRALAGAHAVELRDLHSSLVADLPVVTLAVDTALTEATWLNDAGNAAALVTLASTFRGTLHDLFELTRAALAP